MSNAIYTKPIANTDSPLTVDGTAKTLVTLGLTVESGVQVARVSVRGALGVVQGYYRTDGETVTSSNGNEILGKDIIELDSTQLSQATFIDDGANFNVIVEQYKAAPRSI